MPCDRALRSGMDEEGNLLLITDTNLHQQYEEEAINPEDSLTDSCEGGHDHDSHESFEIGKVSGVENKKEKSKYHQMRYEFIKGFLENSPFKAELLDGVNIKISREIF